MKLEIPVNKAGKELYSWLVENKQVIVSQKKFHLKEADAAHSYISLVNEKGDVVKAEAANVGSDATKIKARLVINTTKLMDSHSDVHIDGLWNKSLSQTNLIYLLQEHSMTFKGIITDEVKAFTKTYSWKDLGFDAPGNTQALVFDAVIDKNRNEFMFDQYRKGYVKNHSVGMRYVKIAMCINDEDYKEEFSNWNKYYEDIANKDLADQQGYFFAVTEAKVVEGSAVPKGSNFITPTISVEQDKAEPEHSPQQDNEPAGATHEVVKSFINPNFY